MERQLDGRASQYFVIALSKRHSNHTEANTEALIGDENGHQTNPFERWHSVRC